MVVGPLLTLSGQSAAKFAVMHNGTSRCGRLPSLVSQGSSVGRRGTISRKAKMRPGKTTKPKRNDAQRPRTRPVQLLPICESKSAHLPAN
jgi:hypothetical protein